MSIAPAERVETSLEEIAALDFEPEVPCEVRGCPHGLLASWYGITSCGCPRIALCSGCRAFYEEGRAQGHRTRCGQCGHDPIDFTFKPLKAKP
jgi:hypothetical protein